MCQTPSITLIKGIDMMRWMSYFESWKLLFAERMLCWYCNIIQINLASMFGWSGNTGHKKKRRGSFCFTRGWLDQGIYRFLLTLLLVEFLKWALEVPPGSGGVVATVWRHRVAWGGHWWPGCRWPPHRHRHHHFCQTVWPRTLLWGQADSGCVSPFPSHSFVRSS